MRKQDYDKIREEFNNYKSQIKNAKNTEDIFPPLQNLLNLSKRAPNSVKSEIEEFLSETNRLKGFI